MGTVKLRQCRIRQYSSIRAHVLCGAEGPKGPAAQHVEVQTHKLIFAAIYRPVETVVQYFVIMLL